MDLQILQNIPPWDWPEDAGTIFLSLLRNAHADVSDRLLATDLAGDITVLNDEIADALLSIVGDGEETEEMRVTAALSLGPALDYADMMEFEDTDDTGISETAFHRIQQSLHNLFLDPDVPEDVRRKILEASVRAPQPWHTEAIRAAYFSNDDNWQLTAVFCMRFMRGFDDLILEALDRDHPDIHYQAVCAAGNWEVDAAWSHVTGLVTAAHTDKDLLLAAIDAVASIRPHEAALILVDLTSSGDEDIADAVFEALTMAERRLELEEYDDDDDDDENSD
jgi:hypothetical protein